MMHRAIGIWLKRLVDIVSSSLLLVLLSPVLLAIALLVRLGSSGPILFSQWRNGQDCRPFLIHKFRTMYADVPHQRNPDGSARVLKDDQRITPIGRLLREWSLDELPQLWNVLRGEMSLIGPRPEMVEYALELPEWAQTKFRTRPGCFSLTLIRGRNILTWQARNELDVEYVQQYSLWLDAKILVLGLWAMLITRTGAYCPPEAEGYDTVPAYESVAQE